MAKPEVCSEKAITEGDFAWFFTVTETHMNSIDYNISIPKLPEIIYRE
ncbi:MAG: hypothetical protein ACI4EI_04555 [Muricoprocola sp.]